MPLACLGGIWTKKVMFEASHLIETAAADADLSTSKAETDAPTAYLDSVNPDTLKSGIVHKILIRLNWANAVTLTALRIYQATKTGDYESRMNKLYDSTDDFPAGITDDDEIEKDVEIPFILADEGKIYYAPEWSGASGNIQGYIKLSGETVGE